MFAVYYVKDVCGLYLLRLPLKGGVIPALRTGDVVYTLDREHGLHPAKESGKKPCAGLEDHSPLEGESQKPSRQAKADAVGGGEPGCQATADRRCRVYFPRPFP